MHSPSSKMHDFHVFHISMVIGSIPDHSSSSVTSITKDSIYWPILSLMTIFILHTVIFWLLSLLLSNILNLLRLFKILSGVQLWLMRLWPYNITILGPSLFFLLAKRPLVVGGSIKLSFALMAPLKGTRPANGTRVYPISRPWLLWNIFTLCKDSYRRDFDCCLCNPLLASLSIRCLQCFYL